MFKVAVVLVLLSSSLFADAIKIAVAANVSYAIEELKTEFGRIHPYTKVVVILGSSGKLTAQIRNGAPYGLFMSANMHYPKTLFEDKIATTKPRVYAQGALAYFSSKPVNFSLGIGLLADKKVKKIAIANPKTAPYGKASLEALQNAKLYKQVKTKLVFAESISQVVSYAVTAADIGLIAKSSLYTPKMAVYKEGIHWASVDERLYTPIKQGLVLLKYSHKNASYQAFYDFILSAKAKKILKKYGYTVK